MSYAMMDVEQNVRSNYRLPSVDPKDSQKSLGDRMESEKIDADSSNTVGSSILDLGQVDLRSLEIIIIRDVEFYLLDYSAPSEINMNVLSMRYGDLKVDHLKKTRLALALSASILSMSMIAALIALPYPYKVGALALCGPLFVSMYGLVTQK